MRITLCSVMTDLPIDATCPPMGVLSLASILEQHGHRVQVVVPGNFEEFAADLPYNLKNCDLVGISSTSYNWYRSRQLVYDINRTYPNLTIVLGGVHPTLCHRYCLSSTPAHVVVRYEGEITFPELVNALTTGASLDNIRGITYKRSDKTIVTTPDRPLLTETQLNAMPLPAYDRIPVNTYGYAPFESSRGCYHSCAFCGILFHRSHRTVGRERIVRTIKLLRGLTNRFTEGGIFFTDDSFGASGDHGRYVMEEFSRSGFVLGFESRYDDLVRNELLSLIDKNQLYLLQIGVESGSQEGVDRIEKRIRLTNLQEFAERCAGTGFRQAICYSMAVGFPWEDSAHVYQSTDFAYGLAMRSHSQPPLINNFDPLPGSSVVTRPADYGMPHLGPEFYDSGSWCRSFLQFSRVPAPERQQVAEYISLKRASHPIPPPRIRGGHRPQDIPPVSIT